MTQPAPPRDPAPWPDTFAAGAAVGYNIPLRRSWDALSEQERRTTAQRGKLVLTDSVDDADVLMSQLPCSWVMLVPSRKVDCAARSRPAFRLGR